MSDQSRVRLIWSGMMDSLDLVRSGQSGDQGGQGAPRRKQTAHLLSIPFSLACEYRAVFQPVGHPESYLCQRDSPSFVALVKRKTSSAVDNPLEYAPLEARLTHIHHRYRVCLRSVSDCPFRGRLTCILECCIP